MNNEIHKIFQVFDAEKEQVAQQAASDGTEKRYSIHSSFYSPGTSFQYLFDYFTREFNYVSENVEDAIGIAASEFTPALYYEAVHPDDLEHIRKCEELAFYFLLKVIPKEEIPFYKIAYQYRLKNKLGKYKMTLHQSIVASTDKHGNLSNVLGNDSDIHHITKSNNYKVSFIDLRGKKSFLNIGCKEDLINPGASKEIIMTCRELEILKLLSDGYSSKEIANHLFISYDTVRTHRNNILKRTKFKTLTHVISHFIKEGLL